MIRSNLVFLTVGAVAVLTSSANTALSRSNPKSDPRAEVSHAIEVGNATWERAFKNLDAAAISSTFDEEGVNVGADGTCMKGRGAVEAAMRSYFERSGPATATKVEIGDIVLDGDLAYEWGHSEFHFASKPGGPTERVGRYLAIWRHQPDGKWKLLRNLGLPDRFSKE
jgi:uncharacterized protein (TIGR02246 family)